MNFSFLLRITSQMRTKMMTMMTMMMRKKNLRMIRTTMTTTRIKNQSRKNPKRTKISIRTLIFPTVNPSLKMSKQKKPKRDLLHLRQKGLPGNLPQQRSSKLFLQENHLISERETVILWMTGNTSNRKKERKH